jgi:hypothetical protein
MACKMSGFEYLVISIVYFTSVLPSCLVGELQIKVN